MGMDPASAALGGLGMVMKLIGSIKEGRKADQQLKFAEDKQKALWQGNQDIATGMPSGQNSGFDVQTSATANPRVRMGGISMPAANSFAGLPGNFQRRPAMGM